MVTDPARLAAVIEAHFLAASAGADRVIETPNFRVHLWTTADAFYRHVAVPIAQPADWRPAVLPMLGVFERYRCRPALEYSEERWPELSFALEREGLTREARLTAMVCDALVAETTSAIRAPWRLRHVAGTTPTPVLGSFLAALYAAFDERCSAAVGEGDVLSLQRAIALGRTLMAVVEDEAERPIAGASLIGIGRIQGFAADVGELAGVWTAEAARGQGLARAVTAALLQRFFAQAGGLVWLAADDALAEGLYRELGFRPIGYRVRYAKNRA